MSKERSESTPPDTPASGAPTISALPQPPPERDPRLVERIATVEAQLSAIREKFKERKEHDLDTRRIRIQAICSLVGGLLLLAVAGAFRIIWSLSKAGLIKLINQTGGFS